MQTLFFLLGLFYCFSNGWCDEEYNTEPNYYEDNSDNYFYEKSTQPNLISYGGLSIQCDVGCGQYEDPNMHHIATLVRKAARVVSHSAFPLWIGSDLLEGFNAWQQSDFYEYEAFDWAATGGFLTDPLQIKTYNFESYQGFLELANALRQDVQFYFLDGKKLQLDLYKSTLEKLHIEKRLGGYREVEFGEREKIQISESCAGYSSLSIRDAIKSIEHRLKCEESEEARLADIESYQKKKRIIEKAITKIDALYRDIFVWCLENHQIEGMTIQTAISDLISGDFEEAMAKIRWLIETAEKNNLGNELLAKIHLLKGQVESESCLYKEALLDLTKAIQKNPSMKEAYFERAVAYFELGQFDKAIEDFIQSGVRSTSWSHPTQWGLGILAGMTEGGCRSVADFLPSLFGAFNDISNGLWAFTKNPIGVSQELVHAAQECIDYLRSQPLLHTMQDMVPELKSLLQNDHLLSDFDRGQLVGLIIGKYGTDILFPKYAIKAVKSYHDLKKANQILTFEALASAETAQEVITKATQRQALKAEIRKNGNLKIHPGRQGKHIEGHPNYKDLLEKNHNPSIFKHPDPERLIESYAGTGRKMRGDIPGSPGYQEIVNFEEFIGYAINKGTGERTSTTWGKIHYAQDGIHIVPYYPPLN